MHCLRVLFCHIEFVCVKSVKIIAVDHHPCLNWNSSTLAFPSSAHVIAVPSVHLQEHSAAGCEHAERLATSKTFQIE
jgi:hypothetical protein